MHSIDNSFDIDDDIVEKLDKLANARLIKQFREEFNKLSSYHKERYKQKAIGKNACSMSYILNATKDVKIFNELLKDAKDTDFAFSTLDCVDYKYTLFKSLFNQLKQHKDKYIEYVKGKNSATAMSGILNATKDVGIFNKLLQIDQAFAFNTLDCTSYTPALFKILFNQLKQHKDEYIKHVKRKSNASAMSAILNATKDVRIFDKLLQTDQDFAFKSLDRTSHTPTLFKILFNQLKQREGKYIQHVKRKNSASAMSATLNVIQDDDISIGIFNELLQTKKALAFNTLDRTGTTPTLFKILFNQLKQHEGEYIEHVKGKNNALAMSAILNATKDVASDILNVTQADRIFNELLQIDQDFAFNTLDDITPKCTLFKTLFDKLDAQTKADYKIHLQRKTTVMAKSTLRNFYSYEDEFLLQEAIKVSSYNQEQFKNFASELEGCVLSMGETTVLAKSTLRNSYSYNKIGSGQPKKQRNKKDEFLLQEAGKRSSYNPDQLKNFASKREGCVLSIMNPITETIDSAIPEEHTSNSSENESISQDTWSTLEELEDQLPDELKSCENQQLKAILNEFHAKEYGLEGVSVEPAAKRRRDS